MTVHIAFHDKVWLFTGSWGWSTMWLVPLTSFRSGILVRGKVDLGAYVWQITLVVGTAVTPSQLWKISPQFGAVCCEAYSKKALGIEGGNLKLVCPDSSEATQVYIHFLYVVLEFMSPRRYVFKSSTLIVENKAL